MAAQAATSTAAQPHVTPGRRPASPTPQPTYHEPTFCTWPSERRTCRDGTQVTIIVCEELTGGRWEPFCSIPRAPSGAANQHRRAGVLQRRRGRVMMAGCAIPQGFPGRAEMRAEQAVLADRIAHGNLACIDRFNLLAQALAALDGHQLPIGEWDATDSEAPAATPAA